MNWAQKKAQLDHERPHADIFQHHKQVFQKVKTYWDQFGLPRGEAKLCKQVDQLIDWIDECLIQPELPQPIEILAKCATMPDLFAELHSVVSELGKMEFQLPEKWQDRIERLEAQVRQKHPQTIEYWIDAYVERVKKRGGRVIEKDSAEDRRYKLRHFRDWCDLGAHITTIDSPYLERYHEVLDTYISPKTGQELSRDSKSDYFAVFRMFVRWASKQPSCELEPPKNLDSKEFTFREPKGTGRKREEKKTWLWTPEEVKTAIEKLPAPYPCYILLMLNCGFRHVDISELQHVDLRLEQKRIVIQRNKLNQQDSAPVISYTLWDKTFELIKETMSNDPTFVFTNRGGGQVESSIKTWWGRNRDEHGLTGKRLDYLRKTGSTFVAKKDKNLDEFYLGESLSTTARKHYSFNDGEPMQDLDEAIMLLGAEFGFAEKPKKAIILTSEMEEVLKAAGIEV